MLGRVSMVQGPIAWGTPVILVASVLRTSQLAKNLCTG